MIKKNIKMLAVTSVVTVLPILAGMILWERLPDKIATHFSADNIPDGFSSKAFCVFGMPAFLLVLHWICVFAANADPKSKNISPKAISLVLWICPSISLLVISLTYGYAFNNEIRIGMVVILFMGILFLIIGNYMPKAGQNYTYGIKLPWTLSDKENWNKTHRLAGRLYMLGGVAMLLTAFTENPIIILCIAGVMVIVPVAYSYWLYKTK